MRRLLVTGASILAGLVLAACGSTALPAPVATSAPEVATVAASETVAAEPTVDATTAPGTLTGAPLPPLVRSAVAVDQDRLRLDAGTFPPLVDPAVIPATSAMLSDDTLVLGAVQNGEARAYPVPMMTFHHVANDVLGGDPYLVTF